MFTREWFWALESELRARGLDSDAQSFDEIRENLSRRRICTPDEFAAHCAYVVLAGGFSQKTAKTIHAKIMDFLHTHGAEFDDLFQIFHNKNKINAVCEIWRGRADLCAKYYTLGDIDARVEYLSHLPHIGKITANHLARNLGEDIVKYDIWIQRLGCVFAGVPDLATKINNGRLDMDIKRACDDMFAHLARQTNLPRGYIDVVLWRACQNKLISMDDRLI